MPQWFIQGAVLFFLGIISTALFDVWRKVQKNHETAKQIAPQIRDLHEWHDRRDTDGVPVWYVRQSLEDTIKDISVNIGEFKRAVDHLASAVEAQTEFFKGIIHSGAQSRGHDG